MKLLILPCLLLISSSMRLKTQQTVNGTLDVWNNTQYIFSWVLDDSNKNITFTMNGETAGWVGFGLSSSRDMTDAHLVIGYIDKEGKPQANDYYSRANGDHTLFNSNDRANDIQNLRGSLENGRTIITFSRNTTFENKYDKNITMDKPNNVIFSMRREGNPSSEDGRLEIHTYSGFRVVDFYKGTSS